LRSMVGATLSSRAVPRCLLAPGAAWFGLDAALIAKDVEAAVTLVRCAP